MSRKIYIKNKLVDVEYKSFSFSTKAESFTEDDDFFYFEGYGSTFGNTDMGNDVVVAGAFKKSLAKKMPKMVYQHDMRQPLGVWVSAVEDGKGLFVRGKMPKSSALAREVYAMMKCGAIDSMSIGFSLWDKESSYTIENDIRYLKEINLWEISPVTIPMNSAAKITQVKAKTKAEDDEDEVDENDLEDAEDDQEDDDDMDDDDSDEGDDDEEEMGKRGKRKKKKCYDLNAVKHIKTQREFEALLRESGVFTRSAAIRLAGLLNQKQSESAADLNKKSIEQKDVNKLKELLNTI